MKVIVTGATGFLGHALLRRLRETDAQVSCIVRSSSSPSPSTLGEGWGEGRLKFINSNLSNIEKSSSEFDNTDIVFHLAAALTGGAAGMFLNNVVATRNLIRVCLQARVKRFILVSSIAVYGTAHLSPGDTLDERSPLDPQPHRRDAYAYSKIAQEKVAWEAARDRGLPLVVIRPGVIYGPGREVLVTRVGLMLGNLLIRMGGNSPLPFTYVTNCADALYLAAITPGIDGHAFNIVDDDPPTGNEIVSQYRKHVRPLLVLPIPQAAIQPISELCERYHAFSGGQLPAALTPYKSEAMWKPLKFSNQKAREILGWQPKVPFSQGLPLALAAVKK